MDTKETLLDIYSDGGEWEDFEPIIDEMLSKIAALTTRLQDAEAIIKLLMLEQGYTRAEEWLKGGTN